MKKRDLVLAVRMGRELCLVLDWNLHALRHSRSLGHLWLLNPLNGDYRGLTADRRKRRVALALEFVGHLARQRATVKKCWRKCMNTCMVEIDVNISVLPPTTQICTCLRNGENGAFFGAFWDWQQRVWAPRLPGA